MSIFSKNTTGSSRLQCLLLKTLLILLCIYIKRIAPAPTPCKQHGAHAIVLDEKLFEPNERSTNLLCDLSEMVSLACNEPKTKLKPCPYNINRSCSLQTFKEHIMNKTQVVWLKDGQIIHRPNGNEVDFVSNANIRQLILYNPGPSDQGRYTCVANYSQIPQESYSFFRLAKTITFELKLYSHGQSYLPDTKPFITHPPANQKEKRGSDVTFRCSGLDTLLSSITYWFSCLYSDKNCTATFDKDFEEAATTSITTGLMKYVLKGNDGDTLVVRNISETSAGYYGCWRANNYGADIRRATLDIIEDVTTSPPLFTLTGEFRTPNYITVRPASTLIDPQATTTKPSDPFDVKTIIIILALTIATFIILMAIYYTSNKHTGEKEFKNLIHAPSGKNLQYPDLKQHLPDNDCLDIYNTGKTSNLVSGFISGKLTHNNGQFMTQSICNQILDEKDRSNSTIRSNNSDEASWGKKSIISSTNGDICRGLYLHTSDTTEATEVVYDRPTGRHFNQPHLCEALVHDSCVINPTYGFIRSDDDCYGADKKRWSFPRRNLKRLNKIGEGQFGEVWRYIKRDEDGTETQVAVKHLKDRIGLGNREKLELIAEGEIMKLVDDHPNVIKLLNCCVDEFNPILLIMEYAENGKLQTYLRDCRIRRNQPHMLYPYYGSGSSSEGGGSLDGDIHSSSGCSSACSSASGVTLHHNISSKELLKFSYHIAKGMEYVASKGIIHRDLASRNILVTRDRICKVADFGFARRITDDCAYERSTANPVPVKWMAPEALVENKFTSKSDVFSLGILMWEIVTLGGTPYEFLSSSEVYKMVTSGGRLERPNHCKDEFYKIMSQCWSHDPAERPTFKELALQLEKLLLSDNDYIELDQYPEHAYYNILNTAEKEVITEKCKLNIRTKVT